MQEVSVRPVLRSRLLCFGRVRPADGSGALALTARPGVPWPVGVGKAARSSVPYVVRGGGEADARFPGCKFF